MTPGPPSWGSRGRRFKSGRPDQWLADQKGFRILVRDLFWIFGSQTGSHLSRCLLVTVGDGLRRSGPLLAEDLVHGRGAGGERGPNLVPVDGLGDRCAAVADQVADVLNADAMGAEDGHERVP